MSARNYIASLAEIIAQVARDELTTLQLSEALTKVAHQAAQDAPRQPALFGAGEDKGSVVAAFWEAYSAGYHKATGGIIPEKSRERMGMAKDIAKRCERMATQMQLGTGVAISRWLANFFADPFAAQTGFMLNVGVKQWEKFWAAPKAEGNGVAAPAAHAEFKKSVKDQL